jgi:ADP-ribose pyrophosphatase
MAYLDFKPVLSTPYFDLEASKDDYDALADPYYRITGPNSAISCIFDHRSNVLLVSQFRPSLGKNTLEFPAGAVDIGEEPVEAARREILEETGHSASLFSIGSHFHLMMNRTNIRDYLFAGLLDTSRDVVEREAGIGIHWVSRETLLRTALDGRYQQLAGLGILQLLGGVLGVDMWHSSDGIIVDALQDHLSRASSEESD